MADLALITVESLGGMLRQRVDAQYLDVRSQSEFADEHVAGFKNIPLQVLVERQTELSKDLPVILMCTNGKKARLAAATLLRSGFKDVRIIAGGILSWKVHCYPVAPVV